MCVNSSQICVWESNQVYPQLIGIGPERVALPLDCTEGLPMHVNAKQYHAILRRRRTRAKLEAQNKVAKLRKVRVIVHISPQAENILNLLLIHLHIFIVIAISS